DGDNPTLDLTHMLEDFDTALDTLNRMIGVRADPNFYVWDQANGGWSGFAQGFENGASIPIDYESLDASAFNLNDYPVKDNCPFQNAAMDYPFSLYATRGTLGTLPNGAAIDGSPA